MRRPRSPSRVAPLLALASALAACGAPPPPSAPAEPARADRVESSTVVVKLGEGSGGFARDDRDGDGIGDAYDLCPAHAEDGKGPHPWDGCPDDRDPAKRVLPWPAIDKQAVKVTRSQIEIAEEILFAPGSAGIDPASQALLRSIAQVLRDVPEIEIVEIAGHADPSGSDAANKKLTEQRAGSVLADLAGKGVARARLRAVGYSAYCARGGDEASHARSRRVEFRILRRDGEDLSPPWGGCAEAQKHGMAPLPLPPAPARTPPDDRRAARECGEGEAKECTQRCERGDVSSCGALANLFADEDPKRAFAAASKACELSALWFCARVATALRQGKGVARDAARAQQVLLRACDKGDGRSCTEAGRAHHDGDAPRDPSRAVELWLRGCEAGDAAGCGLAAAAFWDGAGAPKQRPRAAELHVAACELGDPKGCEAIGKAHKDEPAALARSRGRALSALHVACEQDESAAACEAQKALGEKPGEHLAPPVCAAGDFKACRAACQAGKGSAACLELGVALLYGTGVRRRSADAQALFAEACLAGSARGCALSGLTLAGNNDDPKAERLAAAAFEKACSLGEAPGCVNRAVMESEGLGTYRDEAGAARALDDACGKGAALACAHGSALAGKRGDPRRARVLVERACQLGFGPTCPAR